jgi:hypothetical protein
MHAAKVHGVDATHRPTVSKIVSMNRVDGGGSQWTGEDCALDRKLRDCRTLATRDERHRLVTKCRLPRFETSRAYGFELPLAEYHRPPNLWRRFRPALDTQAPSDAFALLHELDRRVVLVSSKRRA